MKTCIWVDRKEQNFLYQNASFSTLENVKSHDSMHSKQAYLKCNSRDILLRNYFCMYTVIIMGRAVALALRYGSGLVSQARSRGICGEQSGTQIGIPLSASIPHNPSN